MSFWLFLFVRQTGMSASSCNLWFFDTLSVFSSSGSCPARVINREGIRIQSVIPAAPSPRPASRCTPLRGHACHSAASSLNDISGCWAYPPRHPLNSNKKCLFQRLHHHKKPEEDPKWNQRTRKDNIDWTTSTLTALSSAAAAQTGCDIMCFLCTVLRVHSSSYSSRMSWSWVYAEKLTRMLVRYRLYRLKWKTTENEKDKHTKIQSKLPVYLICG